MNQDSSSKQSARKRILDAAETVFGNRGYKAATIREICQKAEVNVASVNYYFNGKKGLYRETAKRLFFEIFTRYPVRLESEQDQGPEVRLHTFIKGVLSRLLSSDGLTGFSGRGKLAVRELSDPSPILDDIVENFIRPTAAELVAIIRELLGPEIPDLVVKRCQISVIGQCFHYAMARPVITRLLGEDFADEKAIQELSDHVTGFSLAGIRGIRDQIAGQPSSAAEDSAQPGVKK